MIKRRPNELWTNYLMRRLGGEGIQLEPYSFEEKVQLGDIHDDSFDITSLSVFSEADPNIYLHFYSMLRGLDSNDLNYKNLKDSLIENILLEDRDIDLILDLDFMPNGRTIVDTTNNIEQDIILSKYEQDRTYFSKNVVDDLVRWAKSKGYRWKKDTEGLERASKAQDDKFSGSLEKILQSVKELERIASESPVFLEPEDKYLSRLYVHTINENVDNIQVFEYDNQRYPYVLVDSSDLEGKPGKPFKNLYFVARDFAPEDWQQKIIAYHESLCVRTSHENAKTREIELARSLGKEREYLEWREQIDNGF